MNARLFFTTFLMIFLAELGDKTQLSVIGRVTDPTTKWIVFAASSLALVCSTLIAVQCGGLLARTIEPRMIKTGAGVLFLVIGALTLVAGLVLSFQADLPAGAVIALLCGLVYLLSLVAQRLLGRSTA